jgi:hypothetical protein
MLQHLPMQRVSMRDMRVGQGAQNEGGRGKTDERSHGGACLLFHLVHYSLTITEARHQHII